jgi:hypothetical protein
MLGHLDVEEDEVGLCGADDGECVHS